MGTLLDGVNHIAILTADMERFIETVVKILGHVYPLRAWCNACTRLV